jgi:hypothetical protein
MNKEKFEDCGLMGLTRRYNSEGRTLRRHRYEHLKSKEEFVLQSTPSIVKLSFISIQEKEV